MSSGPYVWKVGNRYLVTRKRLRPRNAGAIESARCHTIFDCADFDTAVKNARKAAPQ